MHLIFPCNLVPMGLARALPGASRHGHDQPRGKGRTSWHPVLPLLFNQMSEEKKGGDVVHCALTWGKIYRNRNADTPTLHAPFCGIIA
jgi:hypothetical protein